MSQQPVADIESVRSQGDERGLLTTNFGYPSEHWTRTTVL